MSWNHENLDDGWGPVENLDLQPDKVSEPLDDQLRDPLQEERLAVDRVIDERLDRLATQYEIEKAIDEVHQENSEIEPLPKEFVNKLMMEHQQAKPVEKHPWFDYDPQNELQESEPFKDQEEKEQQQNQPGPTSDPWGVLGNK